MPIDPEGCVTHHSAFIYDRGAKRRVGEVLDLSRVQWNRARDAISEGMIRLQGDSCESQMPFIEKIRSHRHELVIFRGRGRHARRVWEGPIHRVNTESDYAEIFATDILAYVRAQPMTKAYDNRNLAVTEVTSRIEGILNYEMTNGRMQKVWNEGTSTWDPYPVEAWESLDPPINMIDHMVVHHWPNEARTTAYTLPFEMSVFTHLASLARYSGIDYTVIGRALHIWDVSRSLGTLRTWTEKDFMSRVKVTEYGSDHAQAAYSVGQEGAYGSALNVENLDYYGPWTTMYTLYNEESTSVPTQPELDSQARRNVSGRSPVPIEVRIPDNSSIILSETLTIDHLVPGVQIPLRATFGTRKLAQLQKLDHVRVTETSEGENIQVTLTPATKPDEDTVDP